MNNCKNGLFAAGERVVRAAFTTMCFLFCVTVQGQFCDGSAGNSAEDYLQRVTEKLGDSALDKIPRGEAIYLAGTFSRSDRVVVSPEVFIEHLVEAIKMRNRFYENIPEESFRDMILAVRIRAEFTSRAGWRKRLNTELAPLIGDETDVTKAANTVLAWVRTKVKLTGDSRTYALNLKGDLDPLTTLRGGRGTETDIAILAVACLRSVGIAARIVYAPVIANENGGKIWMEYRNRKEWLPWVPSLPDAPNVKIALNNAFAGRWAYIIANPEHPINITASYTSTTPLWLCPNPLTVEKFEATAMVFCNGRLQPVMGRDIYNLEPENASLGLGPGNYVVGSGDRATLGGIKPVILRAGGEQGWYQMDFEGRKQQFALSKEKPPFFAWMPEQGGTAASW